MCPVGAELFHADRRTDMTKLIVAFRNMANAPKCCSLLVGPKVHYRVYRNPPLNALLRRMNPMYVP